MNTGRTIFLNGVTSSGKTSIVEALQAREDVFSMLLPMTLRKVDIYYIGTYNYSKKNRRN